MTSIPAVESALVDLFKATLTSTQVYYGPPTGGTGSRICVVGDGDLTGRLDPTSLGLGSTTETYAVPVSISASLSASSVQSATSLAMDDFAAATAAVRDNPSLGIDNVAATATGEFRLQRAAGAAGQIATIEFLIEVFAA